MLLNLHEGYWGKNCPGAKPPIEGPTSCGGTVSIAAYVKGLDDTGVVLEKFSGVIETTEATNQQLLTNPNSPYVKLMKKITYD